MAYALAQNPTAANGGGANSISKAFASTVTAHSLLVAFITTDAATPGTFTVTGGGTWASIAAIKEPVTTQWLCIAYCLDATGGTAPTVQASWTGNGTFNGLVTAEFTNGGLASLLDANTAGSNGNNAAPTDSAMTATGADAVVSFAIGTTASPTVGATFTFGTNQDTTDLAAWEYKVLSGAGSVTPVFAITPSQAWGIISAAFKPAATAGAPQTGPATPGRTWRRRFKHRQTPAGPTTATAPAAATGAADTTQHSATAAGGGKAASGAVGASGRAATAAAGVKGAAAAGLAGQHTETTVAKVAQASNGAARADQRDTTATTTRKQAAGTGIAAGRATTGSTGLKGAANTAAATQRDTTGTAIRKQASVTARADQHTTTADAVVKRAAGAARADQRDTTGATTFTPPSGAASATGRAVTAAAGKRGAASAGLAQTRPATAGSGKTGRAGAATATTRSATASSAVRRALAPATAAQRVTTRVAGVVLPAFSPVLVGVDATTGIGSALDGSAAGAGLDQQAAHGAQLDGSSAGAGVDGSGAHRGQVE